VLLNCSLRLEAQDTALSRL